MTMHPTLHSVLVASPPRRLFLPSYGSVVAISLLTDKFSLLVDRNTSASQSLRAMCGRPLGCKRKVRNLTGGSIAIMCPASHEGVPVKLFFH